MALKFAGRTPSSALRRSHRVLSREAASQKSRAWAIRVAAFSLLMLVVTTVLRVQIETFSRSSTRFASLSMTETLSAPLFFVGEILRQSGSHESGSHESGLHGAMILFGALNFALFLWLVLSFLGEWRRPPVGFLALVDLQLFGWAFHVANAREVAIRTSTIEYSITFSWQLLSRAQQGNVAWSALFLVAILWWWGAGIEARATRWNGPQNAQGFLRKRKVSYRIGGLSLMFFAFAATLVCGAILFGKTLNLSMISGFATSWFSPQIAFCSCVFLDAIYLQGRTLWRRLS